MRIGPKILAWGGLAAFLGIIVVFALPSYRHGEASIAGKRAEDFPMQLNGKPAHLSDLQGKVVVLNFWATWCPPCVEETPALNRLHKYIESRGGMVLGMSVDDDGALDQIIKNGVRMDTGFQTRDLNNKADKNRSASPVHPHMTGASKGGTVPQKLGQSAAEPVRKPGA